MAWAASRPARCPACARGAITRCCSARRVRRRAEWCSSTDSTPGCETGSASFPITTQRYAPDVLHPDGASRIAGFTREPWPTWEFELPGRDPAAPGVVRAARRRDDGGMDRAGGGRWLRAARAARSFRGATITPRITRTAVSGSTPTRLTSASRFGRTRQSPIDRGDVQRRVSARAGLVPELPVSRGRRARPGCNRRSRVAGCLSLAAGKTRRSRPVDSESRRGERSRAAIGCRCDVDLRPCPRGGDGAATSVSDPGRSRRRRLSRPARLRPHDHRRLPVVHRLGPRHVHRHSRPVPRDESAGGGARHPRRVGRRRVGGHAARTGSRIAAKRRNSTRSTRRCGTSLPSHELLLAAKDDPATVLRRSAAGARRAIRAIVHGYAAGTRFGIHMDGDGLLAAGVARRPADVDGRAGRRSGDHAADRQAGRDPGALAQRAVRSLRASTAAGATVLERGRRDVQRALLDEDTGGLADVVDVDHVSGTRDRHASGRTRSSRLEDCR